MLLRAREALHGVGLVYSLNPWVTLGHVSRSRGMPEEYPGMQPVVSHDGIEETCIACPISEEWRTYQAAAWALYAETRPAVIWIEDDIRTFGAHFCLCPLHLERFSRRVGRAVTRDALLNALIQPGDPHPWRAEFFRMQDEIMREAAGHLAATVRAVSPGTRMGLMSSGPRNHAQEGRDWQRFAEAIQPGGDRFLAVPRWETTGSGICADSITRRIPSRSPGMRCRPAPPISRRSRPSPSLAIPIAWRSWPPSFASRLLTERAPRR